MTKQQSPLKIPCAVGIEGLTEDEVRDLHDKFVELGAKSDEDTTTNDHTCWEHYGVDYTTNTQFFDFRESYSENDDESEVTLYTYDEVMNMELSEDVVTEDKTTIPNFKLGDKVKIRKNSKYYGEDTEHNPAEVVGVVCEVNLLYSYFDLNVVWPTGITNSYNYSDLELVEDNSPSVASQDSITATLSDRATVVLPEGENVSTINLGSNTEGKKLLSNLNLSVSFNSQKFTEDFMEWLVENIPDFVDTFVGEVDIDNYLKVEVENE